MEQGPRDFGVISVYLPPPTSITVSTNTFIQFEVCPGSVEQAGFVKGIATDTSQLTVHHFLSLVELREYINPGDSILDVVSLWPPNTSSPPYYLCDSDLCLNVMLHSQAFGDMHLFSLGWTQLSTNCVVWPTLAWLPLFLIHHLGLLDRVEHSIHSRR